MVIYEVNISIKQNIFNNYMQWLKQHLVDMLKIDGFLSAEVFEYSDSNNTDSSLDKQVVVQYKLENIAKLNSYFDKQAEQMRSYTKDLFKDNICITRRVLIPKDL